MGTRRKIPTGGAQHSFQKVRQTRQRVVSWFDRIIAVSPQNRSVWSLTEHASLAGLLLIYARHWRFVS